MPLSTLDRSMVDPVIRRLNVLRPLSTEAPRTSLEYAMLEGIQRAGSGEDLISEGDPVDSVRLVLSGWLCRYKTLEDGRRQIVNFLFPGESCDAHAFLLSVMDHSIAAMTPVVYTEIKRARFEGLVAGDRALAEAFWCETLVNNAIQREWAINLGRRVAFERVAHLFCEIIERLRPVGMVDGNSCVMPVTQMDLADGHRAVGGPSQPHGSGTAGLRPDRAARSHADHHRSRCAQGCGAVLAELSATLSAGLSTLFCLGRYVGPRPRAVDRFRDT
ncbi:CRP-like cAMP-binding protein [Bradyrhizobium sp. LB7.2]